VPEGAMPRQIWVISELYFPEETSTGYLLTKIAEALAESYPTNVLCSQPTYAARGLRSPVTELRNGVHIQRCRSTTLDRTVIPFRLINLITISLSIFLKAVSGLSRGDCVLMVTNPPLLPFLAAAACKLRGVRCLLLIHDVYPEVLVASEMARSGSLAVRLMAKVNSWLYGSADRIIVLGRDMKQLVVKKLNHGEGSPVIIPNWADIDSVRPGSRQKNRLLVDLGLRDKFVLQYAGNMGYTHGLETLVESAATIGTTEKEVHFLFIGSGSKKRWLEELVRSRGLRNVIILPNRPRHDQSNFLNACDVAIISFIPGMAGISVPSRMYNIMAAGKPIIAVTDSESELARVIREEDIGWVVAPGDYDGLNAVIKSAQGDPDRLLRMGYRARRAAETKYSFERVKEAYHDLIASLDEKVCR
jgi:colanic acid biosynthesis glycosyl transferase WcaI